jgi:arabinose-5-phosphate isomerase
MSSRTSSRTSTPDSIRTSAASDAVQPLTRKPRVPRRVARTLDRTLEGLDAIAAESAAEIGAIEEVPAIVIARRVLDIEATALLALARRIDDSFVRALDILLACKGRVVVSGIGKSGHVAHKIAATFASTGTPAFFMHAAEASHGDLGMVTGSDCFVAISNSGEADELLRIMPILKRLGTKLIAITGRPESSLAKLADVHLDAHVDVEACPMNLTPTASTTAVMALGDALGVAALEARGFGKEDYARSHPGGALGRRLLTHVRDVMRTGDALPIVGLDASLLAALLESSKKGMAMTAVVDGDGRVAGIFTDGDLRRLIEKNHNFTDSRVADVMHRGPRGIGPDRLAAEAADLMEQFRINQLLVVDDDQKLVGALHIHDLTNAKVI